MLAILLSIFLFIILYFKNRTWFILYVLMYEYLNRFFFFKIGLSLAPIMPHILSIGVIIVLIVDPIYKKYFKVCILWSILYIIYLSFLVLYNNIDLSRTFKDNYIPLVMFVFAVEIIENLKRKTINSILISHFFKNFMIVQIALCWLQFFYHDFGDLFRVTDYLWKGKIMSLSGNSDDILSNNIMIGTFLSTSSMACVLCFNTTLYLFSKSTIGFSKKDYLYWCIALITQIFIGIKSPMLVLFIMSYYFIIKDRSRIAKTLIGVIALGLYFCVVPIFSAIGNQLDNSDSYSDTVSRSFHVFTLFQKGGATTESTMSFAFSMLPYIARNPLLGSGLHNKSGYYMYLNGSTLEDRSTSDAGIAFQIAELGLLGLAILLFFHFYLIKIVPKEWKINREISLLLLTMFMMSIVDPGVLDPELMISYAFAPVILYCARKINLKNS